MEVLMVGSLTGVSSSADGDFFRGRPLLSLGLESLPSISYIEILVPNADKTM